MPSMTDSAGSTPVPSWVRYADAVTVGLLSLAFLVFVTGGLREKVAGVTISVTSGSRFVLFALLVIGFRHVAVRGRTLLDRVAAIRGLQVANTPPLVRDEAPAARRTADRPRKT